MNIHSICPLKKIYSNIVFNQKYSNEINIEMSIIYFKIRSILKHIAEKKWISQDRAFG